MIERTHRRCGATGQHSACDLCRCAQHCHTLLMYNALHFKNNRQGPLLSRLVCVSWEVMAFEQTECESEATAKVVKLFDVTR